MSIPFKHLSLVAVSLLFMACEGGGSNTTVDTITVPSENINNPSPVVITNTSKNISITDDNQIVDLGKSSNIKATVDVGTTPKSVYVLLSNSSVTQTSSPTISHNKIALPQSSKKEVSDVAMEPVRIHAKRAQHGPSYIQAFNRNTTKLLKDAKISRQSKLLITNNVLRKKDLAGSSSSSFCTDTDSMGSTCTNRTDATARKVISNISTKFGDKTLNIWVSNDTFDSGSGCEKKKCVNQDMVDALAKSFLENGIDNDIYDWVTNIYGEEWSNDASEKYSNLIAENNEITILLTDIDNDDEINGGTIGYFYAKDNYIKDSISNGRVMFYIDSVMFANGSENNLWSIEDKWPKEVVSTLAHEFVHMIEFYQKTVLLNTGSDIWLAEMTAETTEDLVASKIKSFGPRGVSYNDGSAGSANNDEGRYGLFNKYINNFNLIEWYEAKSRSDEEEEKTLLNYSKVNAFGTYLIRNYGGAQVLHDIMHNTFEDEQSVVSAVNKAVGVSGKTFADLQKEWGIAVLLSDHDDLAEDKPTYNTGDFTNTTYNDVTYELGSINFFNYSPTPKISTRVATVAPKGNFYYKVGDNMTGIVEINLTVDSNTEATLIVK